MNFILWNIQDIGTKPHEVFEEMVKMKVNIAVFTEIKKK